MSINLTRPIVFFDLETTGLTIGKDHIVEISLVKLFPDGHRESYTQRINPGMHIPEEATAVHHITDEDVADKPHFKEVARKIADYIAGCDLGGFNSNRFDIPMLAEEFMANGFEDVDLRKSNFVDVQVIFHKKEQRTLSAAYMFYCDKVLEGAHGAEADTQATVDVFEAQMDKYDDLPKDIKSLAEFASLTRNVDFAGRIVMDDKGVEVFNFGKHKGKPVEQVFRTDLGYYDWMMQSDFSLDTKRILTKIRLRMGNIQGGWQRQPRPQYQPRPQGAQQAQGQQLQQQPRPQQYPQGQPYPQQYPQQQYPQGQPRPQQYPQQYPQQQYPQGQPYPQRPQNPQGPQNPGYGK